MTEKYQGECTPPKSMRRCTLTKVLTRKYGKSTDTKVRTECPAGNVRTPRKYTEKDAQEKDGDNVRTSRRYAQMYRPQKVHMKWTAEKDACSKWTSRMFSLKKDDRKVQNDQKYQHKVHPKSTRECTVSKVQTQKWIPVMYAH